MIVEWSLIARQDVEKLRAYIGIDNRAAARRVSARILESAELLMHFPDLGRAGRVEGTRELVVPRTPYLRIYRARKDSVEVMRVLHGAQRWPPNH